MNQSKENEDAEKNGSGLWSWEQLLELLEERLEWYRSRRLFVTLKGESGTYQKEIGKLSALERRSLAPALREYIAEQLLERYLAEQRSVDLLEKGHAYTKHLRDLTPPDLPAAVEAERYRVEEFQRECERRLSRKCAAIWNGFDP